MKKATAKKSSANAKSPASARAKSSAAAGKSAAARSASSRRSASRAAKSGGRAVKKPAPATASNSNGSLSSGQPLISKQPQSKQQAAVQHGMFLHTDDAWSLAYFNSNDLHCVERELFG